MNTQKPMDGNYLLMHTRISEPTGPQLRAENIYQILRKRICTNRIAPGEMLREEDLARAFQVSRSPIRKVLAKLEHDGLVEVRHGVGTHVTRIDAAALHDIYDVRMIMAAQTGPYFVTPLTLDHARMFMDHKRAFADLAPGDVNGFADVNLAYYLDLTGLIANRCLRDLHLNLFYATSRMWLIQLPLLDWQATIESIGEELDELVRALRHADPTGLGYAMRNSIAVSLKRFESAAGSQD